MNDRPRGSRLPKDPAYWDALAARAVAASLSNEIARDPAARPGDGGRAPWWTVLADASATLAAAAVVALLGGAVLLGQGSTGSGPTNDVEGALYPEEPMLQLLIAESAVPPPATALVTLITAREDTR